MSATIRRRLRRLAATRALAIATIAVAASSIVVSSAAVASEPATPYPGGTWEPGPARYGAEIVENVPLTMDDGTVLKATIAYPTDLATGERAEGPFPVVLEDSPYIVTVGFARGAVNTYFATYGYISVRLQSRGTGTGEGASGGAHSFWGPQEAEDGAAVVRWAADELEGSDGRVAIVGCSFPGGQALSDAAEVGPDSPVKAVVAACIALENVQRHDIMVGGVPTQDIQFMYNTGATLTGGQPATVQWYRDFAEEMLAGGEVAYEREFWHERMPMRNAQQIVDNDIPVLLWAGWNDIVGIAAPRTYAAFQNAYRNRPVYAPMKRDQPATPRYQLIMGDWGHAGGLDSGIALQWIETWLKGVDTGLQRTKEPLHLFEKGTNRWINAAQYPPVDRYTKWHLGYAGELGSKPTRSGAQTIKWGEPSEPGNKLTYATPPFAKGATIAGSVSTTVYASSSNTNLQLIAHLFDVAPDGSETEITSGSVIGSLSDLDRRKTWVDKHGTPTWPYVSLDADSYMAPGRVYRLDILLEPRQWGLLPGHGLRLDLSTKPPAAACPGPTVRAPGNDPCYLTTPQQQTIPGGTYAILTGRPFASSLNLPQLKLGHFADAACSVTPTSNNVCLPQDWGDEKRGRHDRDDRDRDRDDDDRWDDDDHWDDRTGKRGRGRGDDD